MSVATAHYGQVLRHFHKLRRIGTTGDRWSACCPAHPDRHPSLCLWVSHKTGNLLAKCMAGHNCTFKEIVRASGTDPEDWFPPKEETTRKRKRKREVKPMGMQIEATYDYCDETCTLKYQVCRLAGKDFRCRRPLRSHEGKILQWAWDMEAVEPLPYRLPCLLTNTNQPVIVVEGEKDADLLHRLGLVATTNHGGAGKWLPHFGKYLRNRRVAVIPDADEAGEKHAALVIGSAIMWGAASVRLVRLGGEEGYDLSDWWQDCLPNSTEEMKRKSLFKLLASATEYRPFKNMPMSAAA